MKSFLSFVVFMWLLFWAAQPTKACDDALSLITPTVSTLAVQSYAAPVLSVATQSYADSYVSAAPLVSSAVSDYAIGGRQAVIVGGRRAVVVAGRRNIFVRNRAAVVIGGRRGFGVRRGVGRRGAVIIGGGRRAVRVRVR